MEKPFDAGQGVPFGDEEPSVPIRVQVAKGGIRGPVDEDFIPNPDRKIGPNTRRTDPPEKVYMENAEFRPFEEQRELDKKRGQRTLELAKQIYNNKREEINRFERAAKIVNSATDEQKANPTPELAQAMAIYERGRPMTKQRALERAKKEVAGEERISELTIST